MSDSPSWSRAIPPEWRPSLLRIQVSSHVSRASSTSGTTRPDELTTIFKLLYEQSGVEPDPDAIVAVQRMFEGLGRSGHTPGVLKPDCWHSHSQSKVQGSGQCGSIH